MVVCGGHGGVCHFALALAVPNLDLLEQLVRVFGALSRLQPAGEHCHHCAHG